jgi:NAD(P)-dependent dehydrogenase (short-subunit alcohol dehydrogenase family)
MEQYRRVMEVNYFAGINLTQKALPLLALAPYGYVKLIPFTYLC